MTNKANMGKWAEKQVLLWLKEESDKNTRLAFHRLPDARSARGVLASQPADLIVVSGGTFYLLEVKESAQTTRLPKAKVSQWGSMKKFYWAGATPVVLVFMSATSRWVWLSALNLGMDSEDCPPSFLLTNLDTFASAGEALERYFK